MIGETFRLNASRAECESRGVQSSMDEGNERTSTAVASMCLIQIVRIEYVLVEIVVGKVIVSREYDAIVAMIQRS